MSLGEEEYTEVQYLFKKGGDDKDILQIEVNLKNVANIDALIEDLKSFKQFHGGQ